jgi:hypothetical protein
MNRTALNIVMRSARHTQKKVAQDKAGENTQAEINEMQQDFGVGSKPATAGAPGAPGGFNPSPEQLMDIGRLHQEHVAGRVKETGGAGAAGLGNGAIQPTPEQQADLDALYARFATLGPCSR